MTSSEFADNSHSFYLPSACPMSMLQQGGGKG